MPNRFTSQRDVDNKLVGSIIYCPKEDDYFYVTESLNASTVSCVEFKHEDSSKNKKLALNVEDPDHISLKSFFPGFINFEKRTAYWFRRGSKSWHYGYAGSHAVWKNSVVSTLQPINFLSCVVTPEGYDALRGRYPDRDEALWVAGRDDPSLIGHMIARAWSKHMAFAKDYRGNILVLSNGIRIGHVKKDGTLVLPRLKDDKSLSVFKKVFSSIPFEPACNRTSLCLEGDEPDFAVESRRQAREDPQAFMMRIRQLNLEDIEEVLHAR